MMDTPKPEKRPAFAAPPGKLKLSGKYTPPKASPEPLDRVEPAETPVDDAPRDLNG